MFRRFLVVLLTVGVILTAGWYMLKRPDISYNTLESVYSYNDSRFLKSGGETQIHFRDIGPRDAPVIVLVHGYAASMHTWDDWVKRLRRDYRVISLDLPGHGLSRCVDNNAIGIEQFVDTVDRVVTTVDVRNFTLVGSSMGGHSAWAYALEYPEKLDALVLVDAAGWPDEKGEGDSDPLIFKLLRNGVARKLMKDLDMSALIRSGLEKSFADPALVDDPMVERYSALSRAPCHREALLKLMSGATTRVPATSEALARISAPTLVMQGEVDNLVPAAHGRKFAEAIPGAELKLYPNVGHIPQEEIGEMSADDLRAFLAEVYAPALPAEASAPTEGE
ncbi:alpha/beta fold hydrolase [Hyphomonas pacifica]|uniref:AB hydrolase-1 domain-containing protein n=1 Tax=Hyphomonas pacifica TaxID=1280941 RepID=A0A062U365_9PROT|nr:alpha/beta hydrolase [Hyphomonas pacifica]KCZ51079.1 hypothetical protein HY2_12625 [Hyphomonas pacifica]RAN35433.1 hypothetical protein HY3_07790 [Hyphomonas pacifica]